ncbi:hypothetical protein K1719_036272 [Acacia pycnantha]|nr:hypothetical protein K1719_036272 [Acacia pycnantha]
MLVASERIDILPGARESSCSSVCPFSRQEHSLLASEESSKSAKKLCGLIVFYAMVMLVEVVGGLKANSLAVMSDAAHLLSDIAGFTISLFAVWASGWEATPDQSFGYNRLEHLGDFFTERPSHHHHHHHGCGHSNHDHGKEEEHNNSTDNEELSLVSSSPRKRNVLNINLQGAYLHVMADLIQSVGVMIAGAVIWAKPDWLVVDLFCTLIFCVISLGTTVSMLNNIYGILMEKTPSEIDIVKLENGLKGMKGVRDIHDLHIWAITVGKNVLSCHVVAEPGVNSPDLLSRIRHYCEKAHKIYHVTIQIE